jgi:putative ABC transport system ATP-binding protein
LADADPALADADPAVVEVVGGTKRFGLPGGGGLDVLDGVSLTVAAGTSCAVMGTSGAGKSTLLRLLALFDRFDGGRYRFAGADTATLGDRARSRLRARSIGFVFQQFRLLDNLTALENVDYAARLAGMHRRSERRAASLEVLGRVGLDHRLRSRPRDLSGGEQQRVAIARALVKRPRLVLADEPTGALDRVTSAAVLDLLVSGLADDAVTLVVVTHDAEVAARADTALVLEDGALVPRAPAAGRP